MSDTKENELGGGAQFDVLISPENDTAQYVTTWKVTFSQGNWSDSISSDNPDQRLKTPNLSGNFDLSVMAEGPNFPWQQLQPTPPSTNVIGCNSNCFSFVAIVATPGGDMANFVTTWDAACS